MTMLLQLTWILSAVRYATANTILVPNPNEVRNDYNDVQYNSALINPLIAKLENFVTAEQVDTRLPDDVALIQTVTSLQLTMFELATFYSRFYHSTNFTAHGKGVAIEFEAQRCDKVYSSKFPRYDTEVFPWKYYGDSSYYNVHCKLPTSKRKRREVSDSMGKSLFSEHDYYTHRQKRVRRSLTVDSSYTCGEDRTLKGASGSFKFPVQGQYSNLEECNWVIVVPVRYAVLITITMMDLEENKGCNYDNVTFHEGRSTLGPIIKKLCGQQIPLPFASKSFEMAMKFQSDSDKTDFKGFTLNWTITTQTRDQSNLVLTSTIVVDQIGDINIDTMDESTLAVGEKAKSSIDTNFKLRLNNPSTCPIESDDGTCYFETRPYIISKIISTGMSPVYVLPNEAIEVVFDHAIQESEYPDLYLAPKFCVTWNSTVPHTAYGAWSRRHGSLKFTSMSSSTCRFSITGIHAVAAAVPPPVAPPAFRFTRSWYFGLYFSVIWITITFITVVTGAKMNIPEWLNLNQLLALLLFCGITLSGMQMEFHKSTCSLMTFFLYYFGLAVFVWHFLKAAQFTGVFDKFFKKERNLYAFYLILGWGIPMFIAGMAGGSEMNVLKKTTSCWMALVGGPIWGYTSPTYFLVLAICFLYYHGLRKTKSRMEVFNYPKLTKRAIRDFVVLLCFIITWACGVLCVLNKEDFAPQFFFCAFLCLTVTLLCLYARQKRRGFEKIYDLDDNDYGQKHKRGKNKSGMSDEELARKYAKKWRRVTKNPDMSLTVAIEGLREARLWGYRDNLGMQQANRENKWNNLYSDGNDNLGYDQEYDEEEDDDPLRNLEEIKDNEEDDNEISSCSEEESTDDENDAKKKEKDENKDEDGNETDVGSLGDEEEEDEEEDDAEGGGDDAAQEEKVSGKGGENETSATGDNKQESGKINNEEGDSKDPLETDNVVDDKTSGSKETEQEQTT